MKFYKGVLQDIHKCLYIMQKNNLGFNMNIVVIGTGGIGTFYGLLLEDVSNKVRFIARTKTLEYLKSNKLKLTHPNFEINKNIDIYSLDEIKETDVKEVDLIIITTKSMSSEYIALELKDWFKDAKKIPYILSLQNGVENEDVFATYINEEYILGGITRLIAAHIIKIGHVDSTGSVETVIGAIKEAKHNQEFLLKLKNTLDKTPTKTILSSNIKLDLWKKLIINNGVNAICALLEEKSGTLINDVKTSKIVYGLMSETAIASRSLDLNISDAEVKEMFVLMQNFDSIKPSMWIDKENNRDLELDSICGTVIKYCEKQGLDAPYTRTVSTLLEYSYNKQRD